MSSNIADEESPPSMIPRRKVVIATVGGLLATPLTTSNATAQQDESPPSLEEIRSTLNLVSANTDITIEVSDADPSIDGIVIQLDRTEVVTEIVLGNENVAGSIAISEYKNPPQTIREQVAASVTAANAIDTTGDRANGGSVEIISVADITPRDENAVESSARVSLSVAASEVTNPEQLTVIKEKFDFEQQRATWAQLETTLEEVSEEEVTISVRCESFSLFTVAETAEIQGKNATTADGSEESASIDTSDSPRSLESLFISNNPLITAGAIVGPIFGYGIYRLAGKRQDGTDQSTVGSISTTTTDTDTQPTTEQSGEESTADVDQLQEQAAKAIERAERAADYGDFDMAVDSCEEAITQIEQAIARGDSDSNQELKTMLTDAQATIETVTERREQRTEVVEVLKPAERSFQEAIVGYIEGDQTVARIRFRQARDTFEEAHETIAESEDNLLTEPVAVDVQPDRELPSRTFSELSVIPEGTTTELADAGIETVDDLDTSNESPWTPAAVEGLVNDETIEEKVTTTLTLLSWWHGDESYTFETAEAVERRQQQADYGFNQSS